MTKKEQTNRRDLTFSKWCRHNLPDSSTGMGLTDLDFIFYNWKNKTFMLVEIKCNMNTVTKNQRPIFNLLHQLILTGIKHTEYSEWQYKGFNLIQFERRFFDDGKCYLNNKEISEQDLIQFLSI